jgi:hypothetical protein
VCAALPTFLGFLRQDVARFEGHLYQGLLCFAFVMQPMLKRDTDAL